MPDAAPPYAAPAAGAPVRPGRPVRDGGRRG